MKDWPLEHQAMHERSDRIDRRLWMVIRVPYSFAYKTSLNQLMRYDVVISCTTLRIDLFSPLQQYLMWANRDVSACLLVLSKEWRTRGAEIMHIR